MSPINRLNAARRDFNQNYFALAEFNEQKAEGDDVKRNAGKEAKRRWKESRWRLTRKFTVGVSLTVESNDRSSQREAASAKFRETKGTKRSINPYGNLSGCQFLSFAAFLYPPCSFSPPPPPDASRQLLSRGNVEREQLFRPRVFGLVTSLGSPLNTVARNYFL